MNNILARNGILNGLGVARFGRQIYPYIPKDYKIIDSCVHRKCKQNGRCSCRTTFVILKYGVVTQDVNSIQEGLSIIESFMLEEKFFSKGIAKKLADG